MVNLDSNTNIHCFDKNYSKTHKFFLNGKKYIEKELQMKVIAIDGQGEKCSMGQHSMDLS